MDQHVEHLWLDADDGAVPMQLAPVAVDFAVSEYEGHVPASQSYGLSPANLQRSFRTRADHRGILAAHGLASATLTSRPAQSRQIWCRCR
jgi:hypothetical protein